MVDILSSACYMHRGIGGSAVSRTRYARSGALRIAYELRGTVHRRRPWLVLIQGMGLDRLGWEPVLRNLGRHFPLVPGGNPGLGARRPPGGAFASPANVSAIAAGTG